MIIRNISYNELDSLDLIVSAPFLPKDRISNIESVFLHCPFQNHRDLSGEEISRLKLFALQTSFPAINSYWSIGEKTEESDYIQNLFLQYGKRYGINKGRLRLGTYEGLGYEINKKNNSVYIGGGYHANVLLLERPLNFDPNKELFFVRNPNGKIKLEGLANAKVAEALSLGSFYVACENENLKAYPVGDGLGTSQRINELITREGFEHTIKVIKPHEEILLAHIIRWNKNKPSDINGMYTKEYLEAMKQREYYCLRNKDIGEIDFRTFDPKKENWEIVSKEKYDELEGKIRLEDYVLVYMNINELLEGRKWAFNFASFEPDIASLDSFTVSAPYNMNLFDAKH